MGTIYVIGTDREKKFQSRFSGVSGSPLKSAYTAGEALLIC